jgi:hypothetical protein
LYKPQQILGKDREMKESFQVDDGRGTVLTLYPKEDGGFHVDGTFDLSPLEVTTMQYASLSLREKMALESTPRCKPLVKLNGVLDNIPKARLVSQR